ncbi:MAG: ATP-dependent serine protease [Paludibacteraceae bacterium]|nr:ATP-dependent serine protease [Paludibacteraceae bacterium]
MRRALSLKNCLSYKERPMGFTGVWRAVLGDPECCGSWIIYGMSGNGKTRLVLQLTKYLMSLPGVKTAYNGLEEGLSGTFKRAIEETGLSGETMNRFVFWNRFGVDEMTAALKRRRSANIVIIDSLQYLQMSYEEYKTLTESFPGKLFIWISHEKGGMPDGALAKRVMYNSNVVLRVKDYYGVVKKCRYGGGETYNVWPERVN